MRRIAAILISIGLLAAISSPPSPATEPMAARAGAAAAATSHLPHFDLLDMPTSFESIPRILRFPLEEGLPTSARHGFWKGKVRLSEGTVTAIGNRRMICFQHKLRQFGGGSCDHTRRVLHKGLSVSSFCVDRDEDVRISGLVPNGITALGVDRHADGEIEETTPVKDNAFTVVLAPAGVVLHGIGPDAHGLTMKYPLGRLSKDGRPCGG